jgi:putative OPT family oligopeptide transporter
MFKPVVASEKKVAEFTFRALFLGVLLGLVFGIGNAYLGLKVGTTVSASIPAAVMSMAILRALFKKVTILENNLVQTIASVGEGLAAGVIFTVPALFLLGEYPSVFRIFLLSVLGGILGVLFMIPMRRYIIVQEHGKFPFPEGTACAQILKSGVQSGKNALLAFVGIGVGALYKACSGALHLWSEVTTWTLSSFQKAQFSIDCTPSLLGVGFIIGPRIASLLFAGGLLAWGVIIPLIHMFGQNGQIIFPATTPISAMSAEEIWSHYVRYIGAGCVAIGGLISLVKIGPIIGKTFTVGFRELLQGGQKSHRQMRIDRDISLRWLILGSLAIILMLWLFPGLPMNFLTIFLLVVLGFFFVAVTSLTVGIVGSTSNPVSGMTLTTLLITCLIFVSLGWTERAYLIAALTMGVVANVAIAMAGTTSQDLKTGYLVGATPRLQQVGEIIGVLLPAVAIGGTLYLLNNAYGFGSAQMPAPQGTMMALVAKGVIHGDIPLTLVIVGAVIGLLVELLRLPILPFAIGLYLPFSLSSSIMVGGLFSFLIKKFVRQESVTEKGVLAASGLIAGDACMGVVVASLAVLGIVSPGDTGLLPAPAGLIIYLLLGLGFATFVAKKAKAA